MLETTLPPDVVAICTEIRDQYKTLTAHHNSGEQYYLSIGKCGKRLKEHPLLDQIGWDGVRPFLPCSIPWLNRCVVMWDGEETGDLKRGRLWAKHNYLIRNSEEPYRSAEIVEAYRNRLRSKQKRHLPSAITAGKLFVRSPRITFPQGSAMLGDHTELLRVVPDGIIDAIVFDPPYGLYQAVSWPGAHNGRIRLEWDKPLQWDALWPELWRVLRPNGTIVITAAEPLASILVADQRRDFVFRWHWFRRATNTFGPRVKRPLNVIEPVLVFSKATWRDRTFNPQTRKLEEVISRMRTRDRMFSEFIREAERLGQRMNHYELQPADLIEAPKTAFDTPRIMWGQKPVSLMRYLVRSHTNLGDTVVDICAGSMSTAVACVLEDRKFLMFEKFRTHFALGVQRLTRLQLEVKVARDRN